MASRRERAKGKEEETSKVPCAKHRMRENKTKSNGLDCHRWRPCNHSKDVGQACQDCNAAVPRKQNADPGAAAAGIRMQANKVPASAAAQRSTRSYLPD